MRMEIRRVSPIKEGNDLIGHHTRVKVVKNKLAPPFREAEFDIIFGQGISKEGDLLDLAAEQGLITKSGAWYSYGSERMAQGRENAKAYLKEHPEVVLEVERQIRASHGMPAPAAADKEAP
jgi:recombination protein RecA